MTENINNLAFTFFSGLVICSILSDSYIIINNILNNNYIKKKISYCKKLYKIIIGLSFNFYKRDEEGNIIIEDIYNEKKNNNKCTNPFDDDYIEENLEELLEELNKNKEEIEKIDPLFNNYNKVENKLEEENKIGEETKIEEKNNTEEENKNIIIDLKSKDSPILNDKENSMIITNSNESVVYDNLIFKDPNINEYNSKDIQIYKEELKSGIELNHINNLIPKEESKSLEDSNINEFNSKDILIYNDDPSSLLPENIIVNKDIKKNEKIETNSYKFVDLSQSKKIGEKIITKKSKSKKNIEEIIKKKSKN